MSTVASVINDLMCIGTLNQDQKKTIDIIGTLLKDSISSQVINAQEKRALELDLHGIADLEVKPFLSMGPVTGMLTKLREKTRMVG